jgi:tetratricopeptide (TPR) repeat protein
MVEIVLRSLLPPFYSFAMVENVCKRKLAERPNDMNAMWLLSNLYVWYGKYSEAKKQLELMQQSGMDTKGVRLLLARVYFQLDKYEKVVDVLRLPDGRVACGSTESYYLGYSLMKMERYDEAIGHLSKYARLKPKSAPALTGLGYSFLMLGSYDKALDAYRKAAQLNPSDEGLLVSMNLCARKLEGPKNT